jgi:hypothetical protein
LAGFRRIASLAALLASIVAASASAQTLTVGDPFEEYLRVLQISGRTEGMGSFTVRPLAVDPPGAFVSSGAHPWVGHRDRSASGTDGRLSIGLTPPQLRAFANSRYPLGRNDGVVWQGRGLTAALDVGATLEWRAHSIEVRPTLVFTQNASYDLAPVSVSGMPPYAYPWRKIDWPQRFGPDAFWTLDPGQSEARVDARGLSFGFGTKNLWWGPAIRSPVAMSNNAPGFPHAFLGTDGPFGIGIGDLEGRWIWGRLQQSDWFDPNVPSDERFVTGIVLTHSPSFVEGLSLGVTRLFYVLVRDAGVPLGDYLAIFRGVRKRTLTTPDNPTGDDEHDQLISAFGRWVLAESGFEVYGEWARNDHIFELRDFLLEPEHSRAYTLGLRKTFDWPADRLLVFTGELTKLERSTTLQVCATPAYSPTTSSPRATPRKARSSAPASAPGAMRSHSASTSTLHGVAQAPGSSARSTTTTPTTTGPRPTTRPTAATTSPSTGGTTRSGSWTTWSSARG